MNTKTCPLFCNNQQPTKTLMDERFENREISDRVYSRIFSSFCWWIFGHTMHLDQSRARAKIFGISIFLLLAKSVAMDPFPLGAHSSSSSSSSSPSSSSSSSSSPSSSGSFLNLILFFFSSAFVRSRLIHLLPSISFTYHRTKSKCSVGKLVN